MLPDITLNERVAARFLTQSRYRPPTCRRRCKGVCVDGEGPLPQQPEFVPALAATVRLMALQRVRAPTMMLRPAVLLAPLQLEADRSALQHPSLVRAQEQLEVLPRLRHLEMADFVANIIGSERGLGNQSATLGYPPSRVASR